MRIGIDISQIVYSGTGVARFTTGLINAILNYDRNHDWIFFFSGLRQKLDEVLEEKIKQKGHKVVKWNLPPAVLSFLWNDLHLKSKFLNHLDFLITSDWTEPNLKCKKATIVHDLAYLRYPETIDSKILATQKKRLHWVKKESQIIFVDSRATKDDLIELLGIDEKKIIVNYPGIENLPKSPNTQNLPKSFILTVGKIEPRKNIKRLVKAFEKIETDLYLYIVGTRGWEDLDNLPANVKLLNYVSDAELYKLYSECLFFIYPSLWEGFGYPVLEAMKLGTPVACSNTSSLKEIGQGAAYLFDPLQIKDIQKALEVMINDEKLRKKLGVEGKKRAKDFTWKKYYDKLMKSLNSNI